MFNHSRTPTTAPQEEHLMTRRLKLMFGNFSSTASKLAFEHFGHVDCKAITTSPIYKLILQNKSINKNSMTLKIVNGIEIATSIPDSVELFETLIINQQPPGRCTMKKRNISKTILTFLHSVVEYLLTGFKSRIVGEYALLDNEANFQSQNVSNSIFSFKADWILPARMYARSYVRDLNQSVFFILTGFKSQIVGAHHAHTLSLEFFWNQLSGYLVSIFTSKNFIIANKRETK